MKISTLKFGNTDPDLRKSSFILYLIYIISNPVGISIGVISPNQFPLFIQIFDIFTILAAFLSLGLFLLKVLEIKPATYLFAFILTADLIVSDSYAISHQLTVFESIIFRDAFIFSISMIVTGFICGRKPVLILGIAYEAMLLITFIFSKGMLPVDLFLLASLLVFGFSVTVLIYNKSLTNTLNKKLFYQNEVNNRDKILLQKELELIKNKSDHLQEIVHQKNRELTSNALLIAKHNERNKFLIKKIEEFSGLSQEDQSKKMNEIKSELAVIGDTRSWEKFQKHFESVHHNFYKTLISKYPDLSPTELKLAAFIKLGLASKDIASLTYNTKESIDVARSRLRKKLKLSRTDNFELFLKNL